MDLVLYIMYGIKVCFSRAHDMLGASLSGGPCWEAAVAMLRIDERLEYGPVIPLAHGFRPCHHGKRHGPATSNPMESEAPRVLQKGAAGAHCNLASSL
jgi:hypothetical protein